MSAIPYRLSQELSRNLFRFPFQVYRGLLDVLLSGDGLGLLTQYYGEKCNPEYVSNQASYFVLKHTILRTAPFCKIFEFIRIRDIKDGLPTIGIAGVPFRESTIKNTLRQLRDDQAIVKLKLPRSEAVTALYGLNVPVILEFLDVWWESAIHDRDLDLDNTNVLTRSMWSRGTQNILKCLCEYFEHFKKEFKFLTDQNSPIIKFDEFLDELKSYVRPKELRELNWDIVQNLKTASRVRIMDLIPKKWKNPDE
jgi:hypothetical protein